MPSPIISPAGPLALDGGAVQVFNADQPVTWTSDGGTLLVIDADSAQLTLPNKTGNWHIIANNEVNPVTKSTITVRALLPNTWDWRNPITLDIPVLVFTPILGPLQTRGFGDGSGPLAWELGNSDIPNEELVEIRTFYDWHFPGKKFDMIDEVLLERRTYEIDSFVVWQYLNQDSYEWTMRIKESFPYALVD